MSKTFKDKESWQLKSGLMDRRPKRYIDLTPREIHLIWWKKERADLKHQIDIAKKTVNIDDIDIVNHQVHYHYEFPNRHIA